METIEGLGKRGYLSFTVFFCLSFCVALFKFLCG